jgi:hypothetical protein
MTTRFWFQYQSFLVLVLRVRAFELAIDAWRRKAIESHWHPLVPAMSVDNQRDAVESSLSRTARRSQVDRDGFDSRYPPVFGLSVPVAGRRKTMVNFAAKQMYYLKRPFAPPARVPQIRRRESPWSSRHSTLLSLLRPLPPPRLQFPHQCHPDQFHRHPHCPHY